MTKITILGQGYVGLTTGIGLASLGHNVTGIDLDESKIARLMSGKIPIYEPGLEALMKTVVDKGFLEFSRSLDGIDKSTDMVFICVATPTSESGEADLSYVESSLSQAIERLSAGSVVVMKSTVPIGTCNRLSALVKERNIEIASNPEFLSEGNALGEFQNPSRIIVGADSEETQKRVMNLYQSIDAPKMMCGLTSAETIKHASNSFLALKLSFVNELARLCEVAGADTSEVTYGMSLDSRIGDKFLKPGPGWGGSCFPKDTEELAFSSRKLGARMETVEAAISSNKRTKSRVVEALVAKVGGDISGKTVAVWGLAFKANTDDTRSSPAVEFIQALNDLGATVRAFDPVANSNGIENVVFCKSALEACEGVSVLAVLTEWDEFSKVDVNEVKLAMEDNPVVYDTRGILDRESWSKTFAGFSVLGKSR
jgi:UDPglucose 6-dehydrogenase